MILLNQLLSHVAQLNLMKARNAKFGLQDHDLVEGWDIYQSPQKT
jgi:hypothetical protein